MSDILGVILAGGLSRRMEGPEKSLLELDGKRLIQHVAEQLAHQTSQTIINANGDLERFADFDLPVQPDTVDGFVGPLAGVLAGMRWAKEHSEATHIITAAADTPFFPDNYVSEMLIAAINEKSQICLASSDGNRHPVFGLWPVGLADALESFLVDEQNRKVMLFVERYTHSMVEFEMGEVDPFFNVNTPDDMKKAEHLVSRHKTHE